MLFSAVRHFERQLAGQLASCNHVRLLAWVQRLQAALAQESRRLQALAVGPSGVGASTPDKGGAPVANTEGCNSNAAAVPGGSGTAPEYGANIKQIDSFFAGFGAQGMDAHSATVLAIACGHRCSTTLAAQVSTDCTAGIDALFTR